MNAVCQESADTKIDTFFTTIICKYVGLLFKKVQYQLSGTYRTYAFFYRKDIVLMSELGTHPVLSL